MIKSSFLFLYYFPSILLHFTPPPPPSAAQLSTAKASSTYSSLPFHKKTTQQKQQLYCATLISAGAKPPDVDLFLGRSEAEQQLVSCFLFSNIYLYILRISFFINLSFFFFFHPLLFNFW